MTKNSGLSIHALLLILAPALFFIGAILYPDSIVMGNFLILFLIWLTLKKEAKHRHLIPFLFILAFIAFFWFGILILMAVKGWLGLIVFLGLIGIELTLLASNLEKLGKKWDEKLIKKLIGSIIAIMVITTLIGSYSSLCYQVRQGGKPGPSKAAQVLCSVEPSGGYLPAQILFDWLPDRVYENKINKFLIGIVREPAMALNVTSYHAFALIMPLLYIVILSHRLTKTPKNQQKKVVLFSFLIMILATVILFFLISELIQLLYVGINLMR